MEVWKDIDGYAGVYQVSNMGRVRSLDHVAEYTWNGKKARRMTKGRILSLIPDPDGYRRVKLSKDGIVSMKQVHRLVLAAFVPNPYQKPQVNHINGVRHDNRVENLEWVTHSENCHHKYAVLGYPGTRVRAVICEDTGVTYDTATEAATALCVDLSHVIACCKGRRKHTKGHRFKYK